LVCDIQEHRLGVVENRVLGIIFGPRRDEVTGGWRKLHYKELCDLYSLPSIIIMIKSTRMNGQGTKHELGRTGMRIGYKSEGKRDH
jgi:hypothetical protein